MTTLIIHPKDHSTNFLMPIYQGIVNKRVITQDVSYKKLISLIQKHDRIIMLGHGSAQGLFNVAKIGKGIYTINTSLVEYMRGKELVAIWCNANKFIDQYNLSAIYSGMFISEVTEATYCDVTADQTQVNESNDMFAHLLGTALKGESINLDTAYGVVKEYYAVLGTENPVAKYNSDRWYLAKRC